MPKEKNNALEIIGEKYGRLTVVGFHYIKGRGWLWECKCDCGNILHDAKPSAVRSGNTRSCGCLQREQFIKNCPEKRRKHGMSETRLYSVWSQMKGRCECKTNEAYKNYGGRGIEVCDEWHDFQNFYEWATTNGYAKWLTLERKDVNRGYEPENCCWISKKEQAKNKRNNRYVEVDGKTLTLKEACELKGVPYKAVHLRVTRRGWDVDKALNTPVIKYANQTTYK